MLSMRAGRVVLAFVLLFVGLRAYGQTQFATITGRVTDSSDAAVSEAVVTLENSDTHAVQQSKTGAEGTYVFASVSPGHFKLTVEKQGFRKIQQPVEVSVAARLTIDFRLEPGEVSTTITVEASGEEVNTTSAEVGHVVSAEELRTLPLLTKNPYALIGLAAGAVDVAAGTGDIRGQGFAVNGQRTASINYLLDGTANNESFVTGPAALVPNDAVEQFKVQSNNMTAEFGRNALVTNVVTKSGTNTLHGSASEYYRGAALTANTFQNNATGTAKPNFVRNDFTGALGGPVIKDKTFFFAAVEGVRVRSSGVNFWWVPTQQFVDNAAPNMVAYINAGGGIPSSNSSRCITADGLTGGLALVNANTGAAIPGTTPLFCQTTTTAPVDAGGGLGSDTWNAIGKLDHSFTANTRLSFRYAYTNNQFPVGAGSDTPYAGFRTGASFSSANYGLSLTHTFSANLISESRVAFSRTDPELPFGQADPTIPCVQYGDLFGTPDGFPIVFPGYLPHLCNAQGVDSGGPQNTISAAGGFTMTRGKHTFKWGAYLASLRDNHVFGAFAEANGVISDPQNLLNGAIDTVLSVAIDPRGKVPGNLYDPAVDGPFGPPSFKRHYRYNESAFYGEDAIRLTRRLTVTLGLRWEYFGVLHSPQGEKTLDANFFLDAVGQSKAQNPSKTIYEQIRDGRFGRTGQFFNQDWNNFGPRVGLAWDISGNGRTAVRAGYGIFYDKNFGNALFNAIQNPPNYNVANVQGVVGAVDANQYALLTNLVGTGAVAIGGSARMLNKDMVTAYSQQWSASFEHEVVRNGLTASVTYVGTKGDKLYALNNLNQRGSCILAPAGSLATCNPAGGRTGRINQTGVTGLNRRGNEGFSRYHGVSFEARTRSLKGLTFKTSYTYSHSKDNSSSFFGDSPFDGAGGFGFRDPFHPALDYADSTNDIRHKFVLSYNWEIPIGKNLQGFAKQITAGWSFSGVYGAQSGGSFSVYDVAARNSQCGLSGTNYCYPLLTGSIPSMQQTPEAAPNTFTLYDLSGVFTGQAQFCTTDGPIGSAANFACTAHLYLENAQGLSPRNLFRLPGLWNYDAAISKRFTTPVERLGIEFRAEVFNLFNHSNLYANAASNDVAHATVQANRGLRPGVNAQGVLADRRGFQLGIRVTF